MLNHYIKQLIIALFQFFILALFFVLVVSHFLQASDQLADWRLFFQKYQPLFLIIHGLGYLALYITWPQWISFYIQRKQLEVDILRLNQAISARYYLIGLFIVLELLFQLRP